MSVVQVEDVLEGCLRRLKGGEDPEEILASYPDQALELFPLLEAMADVRQLASEISVPAAAQNRSRAQFLTAAAAMQPAARKPRFTSFHLRLATSAFLGIGIVVAILLGTGLASAASLPGDVFYPVKLMVEQMQINIVQDSPSRLELQETYDNRRLHEAEILSQMNRRQSVTFGGFLAQNGPDHWQVGSVTLAFPADFPLPTNLVGTYVQVSGYSLNQVVEVEDIQARQLQWSGTLEEFDDSSWLVGGVALKVNEETHLTGGKPLVGTLVQVTAIRQSESLFLALDLNVNGGATVARGSQVVSSATPSPAPVERATDSQVEGVSAPVVQPPDPATPEAAPATAIDPPDSTPAMVAQTAVSGDEEKRNERKTTVTPTAKVTVNGMNTPTPNQGDSGERPSTPQQENTAQTRTPTPGDD